MKPKPDQIWQKETAIRHVRAGLEVDFAFGEYSKPTSYYTALAAVSVGATNAQVEQWLKEAGI